MLANVRWATDCQAVASAQADNWIAKTHRQNQNALRFGQFGISTRFPPPLFSACSARRKRNRPAVGYPPYVCRPAVGCPPYVTDAFRAPLGTRASLAPTLPTRLPPLLSAALTGRFGISTRFPPPLFSACSARRKHNRPAVG
jgi:hypothetical protein